MDKMIEFTPVLRLRYYSSYEELVSASPYPQNPVAMFKQAMCYRDFFRAQTAGQPHKMMVLYDEDTLDDPDLCLNAIDDVPDRLFHRKVGPQKIILPESDFEGLPENFDPASLHDDITSAFVLYEHLCHAAENNQKMAIYSSQTGCILKADYEFVFEFVNDEQAQAQPPAAPGMHLH